MRSKSYFFLSFLAHALAIVTIAISLGRITDGPARTEIQPEKVAALPPVEEAVASPAVESPGLKKKKKGASGQAKVPVATGSAGDVKAKIAAFAAEIEQKKVDESKTALLSEQVEDDSKTEATSADVDNTPDPAPVGLTEEPNESTEVVKGGTSQNNAVEYTELKQAPGNPAPFYPLAARREKRQGQVELLYRVTKEGKVTEVQIQKSSGSEDLDAEAVKAVSQYRYVAGQEGWAHHPITFALKGEEEAEPSKLGAR